MNSCCKHAICELRNKIKRHSSHASSNIYTRPGRPGDRYQNQTTITAASSRALVCWRGGAAWQDASDTMHAVVGSQVKILNVTCCTVARDQIDNNNTSSRGLAGWAFFVQNEIEQQHRLLPPLAQLSWPRSCAHTVYSSFAQTLTVCKPAAACRGSS
jgi:hypothetical protein